MNDLINLEDLKDLHQDEMNARIAEANETYNKRVTEVEKGAQKAAERANLGDKALQALVEIGGDDQKFVDLYNEDPKTAKYILEKMYPGRTIEDFKSERQTQGLTKEQMDEFYEGKKVEEKLEAIKSNLSADDKEKFETELKELPKLSAKNFEKYTKIALQQVIPNYSEQENQARIMSMGGGTSKAQGEDGQKVDKATLDFLKNNGYVN